ncbi:hypothetical protein [Streptomyces cucumeris]|uniref:hypothetical protein n=1 Tax=Streptomyces cucumeris TaxID=2962890 RepID=UPI003D736DCA
MRGRHRHPFSPASFATPAVSDGRAAAPADIAPEDLAQVSPYLTEHIRRFGEYSTHELGDEPDAYDPRLDVDFTPPRGDEPATEGFSQAA